ncbi:kinetochore Sim4 complex subunit FTA2-domain-containing protein [Parachaetomium inaequale]|uniref:Kinetochore Sim4 complex subunit FTA2-domain-containing protein n=1 Tax=Parachaetomium inaequale TaxID=2588326 RepID=A0AAN6SNB4_9PEZI|nr:kinetochore Sim4 complex subunit FTA2-domain-containing protein [Parachaetomium inaequale]
MSPLAPDPHPALPRVPGPKLAPFKPTAQAQIRFIGNLGRENDKDAQVWKMFEFRAWEYLHFRATRYLTGPLAELHFYYDYFDPFNCECRVYGRPKAEGCEELAVKAYGYLLLSPEQEAEVTKRMAGRRYKPDDPDVELNGDNFWGRWEEHRGQQVRAIVKDLITDNEGGDYPKAFDVEQIPLIWDHLKHLHSLGILVRDIHNGNYLRGKLVDFSRAWTMYHPCLEHMDLSDVNMFKRLEGHKLELTFDGEYPFIDYDVPQDLQDCAGDETYAIDQRSYQWRVKDGEDVEKHVMEELYADTRSAS